MTPAKRKPKPTQAKARGARRRAARTAPSRAGSFPKAFAALLRSRKIPVPRGLQSAPPDAYARQPASAVDQLASRPDEELRTFAERIAAYASRQAERARAEWDRSPLVAELRRRKLAVPPPPARPAGVSVSLAKPLSDWTDEELLEAAGEWSRRAGD